MEVVSLPFSARVSFALLEWVLLQLGAHTRVLMVLGTTLLLPLGLHSFRFTLDLHLLLLQHRCGTLSVSSTSRMEEPGLSDSSVLLDVDMNVMHQMHFSVYLVSILFYYKNSPQVLKMCIKKTTKATVANVYINMMQFVLHQEKSQILNSFKTYKT